MVDTTESDSTKSLTYRNSIELVKAKSEDDFEKYINIIASGGLALSISVTESMESIVSEYWIIAGWVLLTLTLLVNLISHKLSFTFSSKTIDEIDNEVDDVTLKKNIRRRNRVTGFANWISIITLIFGVVAIVSFSTINMMSIKSDKGKPFQHEKPANEPGDKRGRTIPSPPPSQPPPSPKPVTPPQNK